MTDSPASEDTRLAALAQECVDRGYVNGEDFKVDGVPAWMGSEVIVLAVVGTGFEVRYRDMGRERVVLATADFAVARTVFLEEVAWLAAGRGRGPYVGRPSRAEQEAAQMTDEEAAAAFRRRFGTGDGA